MGSELGGRAPAALTVSHSLDVDPSSGATSLRVGIPCTPGRDGFGPAISLTFTNSSGNSAFGIGWALSSWPAIGIDLTERAPRWDGRDDLQWGGQELVVLLDREADAWRPRIRTEGPWQVTTYRTRRGGRKSRVERWTDRASGRIHFRTWDAGGVVTIYGARPGATARIADPEDELRTLAWLPELQLDRHGNAIWFEYAPETLDGVDRTASFEPRRPAAAQRYLKRILYGNSVPLAISDAVLAGSPPPEIRWHLQAIIDYGDHEDRDAPSPTPNRPWPARRDPFTSCRGGFPVRTHRLARRIMWAHHFDELGPTPVVVGAMSLEHDERSDGTMLTAIREHGYRRGVDGTTATRAVPALRMAYAAARPETGFRPAPDTVAVTSRTAASHRFVDFHGEGLPGILSEHDRSWLYQANLGGGRFGPQVVVAERPAVTLDTFTLGDLDGNGDLDLSQLAGRAAGLFEFAREDVQWREFRPFAAFPHVEALGGHAQWVDLNGDGRPDLVVAKTDSLVWFPSEGDGFGAPCELPLPGGVAGAPTVGADLSLRLFFADMNGDGLADLVRVGNGSIEYWPSLGNGLFGESVVMEDVPQFSDCDLDARRLRFVDLDGSGTTDLVYLGEGEITCWINAAGNRLVPGPRLTGLPRLDNLSDVAVIDFLGDGRPCLVWINPLPGCAPIAYLPLTTTLRPRVLVELDDSRGKLTRLEYASSATHYLRARDLGRPWATRLPAHVIVVDRLEILDAISGCRTVRRYAYHDGYFDGDEREFRGFGRVDVRDTASAEDGAREPAFSTPSLTRTWFHLGTPMWNHHRPTETYGGDNAWLPPHVIEPEVGDVDDGLRSLAGQVIRREVWSVVEHERTGEHPIQVHRQCHALREVQPRSGDMAAAFETFLAESVTEVYEQQPEDPRTTHELVLDVDEFGSPTRTASIGYARRSPPAGAPEAQLRDHIIVESHRAAHLDEPHRFELDIPVEGRRYELAGIAPGASGWFEHAQLRSPAVDAALAAPSPHHEEVAEATAVTARLLAHDQSFYWNTARTGPEALGEVGETTLCHHEESACFAPAVIARVLGDERAPETRLTELGYRLRDGLWWVVEATHELAPERSFSRRVATTRSDGARTQLVFDATAMSVVARIDALGNRTVLGIDYHTLLPHRVEDANGTIDEVERDPLGVVIAATRHGEVESRPWGFAPLAAGGEPPSSLAATIADPVSAIGGVASRVWYDLDAWVRDRAPTAVVILTREELRHDGDGGGGDGPVGIAVAYLDGFGRTLQSKTRVEPGAAIRRDANGVVVDAGGHPILGPTEERWRASGHIVYDGEQRPGRIYEPFFTPTVAFEGDDVLRSFGASTITRYDAVGRVVGRDLPNGTFASATYHPWELERADPNDNVLDSVYRSFRETLTPDAPERQALEHARRHAGTSESTYLDPLGRECGSLRRAEDGTAARRVELRTDVDGQTREIVDPRGLVAVRCVRDMLGRTLQETTLDAGDVWMLHDAHGRAVWTWNPRGFEVERGFDLADRPTHTHVRGGDLDAPLDHRVEEHRYGEDLADRGEAARRNLLGRAVVVRDASGETSIDRCDPAGHALVARRRFRDPASDASEPDWRSPVIFVPGDFVTASRYDGLGRRRADVLPDGTRRAYSYLTSGTLREIRVTTPDGAITDHAVLADATVNARGQRTQLRLGNGIEIEYRYDRDTFRVDEQQARLGSRRLQHYRYTYDPIGNLVRLEDAAAIIENAAVGTRRDYAYDAHYRLRSATGRVHQSLLQHDYVPGVGIKQSRHLSLDNGAAIERYTQTYDLDASGNITALRHRGGTQSWTTSFWVDDRTNRSLPDRDHNDLPIAAPAARFDATGNLRELAHLRKIEWSWRGELARAITISRPGLTDDAERYTYAADGQRARKVSTRVVQGGQVETTEKLYLGDQELRRVSRDGTVLLERWTTHIGETGQRFAVIHRWTRDTLARETDDLARARVHYQLTNHQQSAMLEVDETGRIISYEEHFPYGGSSLIAGHSLREVELKEHRYTGKECDDATGLYYFGRRYYAPWIARWLSPDPIGHGDDLNLYQFVRGDPVGNTDPTGLDTEDNKATGIQYKQLSPPAYRTDDEGKIAAFRASLPLSYDAGFNSLSRDDQLKLANRKVNFVPNRDPRSDQVQWAVIGKAEYRDWVAARKEFNDARGKPTTIHVFSTESDSGSEQGNPTVTVASGQRGGTGTAGEGSLQGAGAGGGKDAGDGKGGGAGPGAAGEGAKAGGNRGAKAGGGRGAGEGESSSSGRSNGGVGDGGDGTGVLGGTGSPDPDGSAWGSMGGVRQGATGGTLGGTPNARGRMLGAHGTSTDERATLGSASGAGSSGSAGGSGEARSSRPLGDGPSTGSDSTRGRGPGGSMQDAQGVPRELSWKNVAIDVAAILSFTSPKGQPGGHAKGIPGGLGWFGLSGGWLQWAYVATAVAGFVSLASDLAGTIKGMIALIKAIPKLPWKLVTFVPRLLRLGARAVGRLASAARSAFQSLRAALTARNAYATSRAFSSGFEHAAHKILEAFAKATHTPISREVLEAIRSGELKIQFRRLKEGGKVTKNMTVAVNNRMHMDDVLHTIVHEGQHWLDILRGRIPIPTAATAVQQAEAELRAWWSAIKFAEANNMSTSALAKHFGLDPRDLLVRILTFYKRGAEALGNTVTDTEALEILSRFVQ
ncbi:MAG: VCBS repeat-containing protein [Deltaproteobacteria bacterium]|nr:VCBS repeat-containing protein [Deltaproteobacteria bacterium]